MDKNALVLVAGNSFYDRDHRIFHASYWPYHCHTGIDHLWVVMVQKDAIFIDLLQFVPLLIGILLAAVQFFLEMQRKCLKLTLHLPYSQKKMVMSMLAYGVLALVTCFAMSFIMMGVYLPQHFTSELVQRVLLSAAPWFLPDLPVICLFHGFAWNPHGSAGF